MREDSGSAESAAAFAGHNNAPRPGRHGHGVSRCLVRPRSPLPPARRALCCAECSFAPKPFQITVTVRIPTVHCRTGIVNVSLRIAFTSASRMHTGTRFRAASCSPRISAISVSTCFMSLCKPSTVSASRFISQFTDSSPLTMRSMGSIAAQSTVFEVRIPMTSTRRRQTAVEAGGYVKQLMRT